MDRTVEVTRALRWPDHDYLRSFEGDPLTWLPQMSRRGEEPDAWQVYLWAGEVGMLVDLQLGEPSRQGATTSRTMRWRPPPGLGAREIPAFEGELALQVDHDRAELLLAGSYRPPLGLLGVLGDRMGLRRLAHATVRQLLADIADQLHHADHGVAPRPPGEDHPGPGRGSAGPV